MKGYKRFLLVFMLVLTVYVIAEMNRPTPVDWTITLSQSDRNPYGGYILYHRLHDLFPAASIQSWQLPVYNQLHRELLSNTAYILVGNNLNISKQDMKELLRYTRSGNYVFLAAGSFSNSVMDSLKFKSGRRFDFVNADSVTINLVNPALRSKKNYGFNRMTMDGYLNGFDTARTVLLGDNQLKDGNFIRIPSGRGAFFVHALPLCFSNYFMLTRENADYTAKALSYLPAGVSRVYWDEYYKMPPSASGNPLRFILENTWLRWAFRTGLVAMVLFVVFGIKRKQRIIPVIAPLRNASLDFVKTVGNVYFNQRDNRNIAIKKITYFLAQLRAVYFLQTAELDDEFTEALTLKAEVSREEIENLVSLIRRVQENQPVSDTDLLALNKQIDHFYGIMPATKQVL